MSTRKDDQRAKRALCDQIITALSEHPEWLPAVFKATTQGSIEAMQTMKHRNGDLINGVTAALSLRRHSMKSGPQDSALNEAMENQVLLALDQAAACGVDNDFVREIAERRGLA